MLSQRFKNNLKPIVKYVGSQEKERRKVKLDFLERLAKDYKYKHINCPCGYNGTFDNIAFKDIDGIPVFIVICRNCGLIMQNPQPDEFTLKDYYNNYYPKMFPFSSNNYSEYKNMHRRGQIIYEYISKKLSCYASPIIKGKRILDIGCGLGGIMSYFRECGHICEGIDLNAEVIEFARSQGHNVRNSSLSEFIKQGYDKFDLIIYNHVLEHVNDTGIELAAVQSVLKENGYIFIGVPSLFYGIKKYDWDLQYYLSYAHNFYFTEGTLNNIMSINGFKKLSIDDSPVLSAGKGEDLFAIFQPIFKNNQYEIVNYYFKNMNFLYDSEDLYNNTRFKIKRILRKINFGLMYFASLLLTNRTKLFLKKILLYRQ